MEKFVSGYIKGIDQDTNVNRYSNNNYYDAQNLRLLAKDSLSSGALTNVNGAISKLSLTSGDSIVGHCVIRDTLILIVANDAGGKIYKFVEDNTDASASPTLIYTDPGLVFDPVKTVKVVGYYETPDIQKIYFTDGETFFYHLNVASDVLITDVAIESLDLLTDIEFSSIDLEVLPTGNLKSGKVQYAYQVYNIQGSESIISPASDLVHLAASSESEATTYDYRGSEVGNIVGKSVEVTLSLEDIFSRVRVFALDYTVYNQIPAIRIVGEYDTENATSITIIDSGQSIGEITLEEFRNIQHLFYPNTIERRFNKLFAGNITEVYFDVDFEARAFRFNSGGVGVVYEGENPVTLDNTFVTLPEENDEVYNKFNDWTNDYSSNIRNNTTYHYKYQTDGVTLGGEGPNISYQFTTTRVLLDDSSIQTNGWKITEEDDDILYVPKQDISCSTFTNYCNPSTPVGYKRDEVYRFAIIFRDLKGRPSFAKWIADIRMPSNEELPYIYYNSATPNNVYADILGVEFTVDTTSIASQISGYQIVRADRTNSDKTILSQGLTGYMKKPVAGVEGGGMFSLSILPYVGDCVYEKVLNDLTTDSGSHPGVSYVDKDAELIDTYMEFFSPDVVINKPAYTTNNAHIEVEGYLNTATTIANSGGSSANTSCLISSKYWKFNSPTNAYKQPVRNYKVYTPKLRGHSGSDYSLDSTLNVLEDGVIFNNMVNSGRRSDDQWYRGARGTFALLKTDDGFGISSGDTTWVSTSENRAFLANYKIDRGRSIYGGSKYEERANTRYYKASDFIPQTTSVCEVYNGDTYINYMWYLRGMWDVNWKNAEDPGTSNRSIENLLMFPVESSINLDLRLDKPQRYMNWGYPRSDQYPKYKLLETVQLGVASFVGSYPIDVGNLYRYNTAYSCTDKSFEFMSKPFDFEATQYFDTRVYASNVKVSGEYIDSWLKFGYNESIDLDSDYGSITRLVNYFNSLYAFQEEAVATLAVNDRSLIQDNNAGALTLGTGGVLTRYDYVTTNAGTSLYNSIVLSDDALYFASDGRKRIYKLTNQANPISLVKGIDSTLDSYSFDTAVSGFDPGYNEVLFNIDGVTWVFNEIIDAFISRYTVNPRGMFSIGKNFYSYSENTDEVPWLVNNFENVLWSNSSDDYILLADGGLTDVVYKHNVGEKATFPSSGDLVTEDSTITLIINPNGELVNYFDNIDFRTNVKTEAGADVPNETFYLAEFSNDYQSYQRALSFATSINENIGTTKRIARVWRFPLVPVQTTGVNFKRMVDTYLRLKLSYDNSTDNHLKIYNLITYFRPAKL